MTLGEAFLFIKAQHERQADEWRRSKMIAWAVFQSQSRKRINFESFVGMEGEKRKAPRSGINKWEHLALIEKYKKAKHGIHRTKE